MTALVQHLRGVFPSTQPTSLPRPAARPRWIGPGVLVAVGFVDPGNWATDLEAGSLYGYRLLGAVVIASGLGWLFQHLSTRVALASGEGLASLTRRHLPGPVAKAAWLAAELAMVATTVAELLGSAIALQLWLGLPLVAGVAVAALGSSLLLAWPGRGQPRHEYAVAALLGWVAVSFLVLLYAAHPQPRQAWQGLLQGGSALHQPAMLAMVAGLIGATVMPHNLYLHSGLIAARVRAAPRSSLAGLIRATEYDTRRGLGLAALVNLAILILAAASLSQPGRAIGSLAQAHQAITASLGTVAGLLFVLALYAAGQSSALTSLVAGREIRQGFGHDGQAYPRIGLWLSRGTGMLAALLLTQWHGLTADQLLVGTQTLLALVLPMAVVPLLILVSRRSLMGPLALGRPLQLLALLATGLILWLDLGQLVALI
ncbi:Nramp family divalent metal transporter [Frateuria aurantia]